MSRVGRKPIEIPKDLVVAVEGRAVKVEAKGGILEHEIPEGFTAKIEENILTIRRPSDRKSVV